MSSAASAPIPVYTPPPVDPAVAQIDAQAQQQSLASLQTQAQMDSASLLARYGTQLSLANQQAGSPLIMR